MTRTASLLAAIGILGAGHIAAAEPEPTFPAIGSPSPSLAPTTTTGASRPPGAMGSLGSVGATTPSMGPMGMGSMGMDASAFGQPERPPWICIAAGVEVGGAPLLGKPAGPVSNSTSERTLTAFARISVPIVSSRTLEVMYVADHGVGATLQNGDFEVGPVKLHLLDIGVFNNLTAPVTVARQPRKWDIVVGAGAEIRLGKHLAIVSDTRLFAPLDLWNVVTHSGDSARLVGEEILHGVQVWAGAALRY